MISKAIEYSSLPKNTSARARALNEENKGRAEFRAGRGNQKARVVVTGRRTLVKRKSLLKDIGNPISAKASRITKRSKAPSFRLSPNSKTVVLPETGASTVVPVSKIEDTKPMIIEEEVN